MAEFPSNSCLDPGSPKRCQWFWIIMWWYNHPRNHQEIWQFLYNLAGLRQEIVPCEPRRFVYETGRRRWWGCWARHHGWGVPCGRWFTKNNGRVNLFDEQTSGLRSSPNQHELRFNAEKDGDLIKEWENGVFTVRNLVSWEFHGLGQNVI